MASTHILGFDSAGPYCSAAILSGDLVVATAHESMARGQAERLFPLLEETLAQAGLGWRDLTALGVGIGPGNFTGIRISVAAARGLALALGIPAIGVSLLDAVSHGATAPVLACLGAPRGQGWFQRVGYGDPRPFGAAVDDVDERVPGLTCVGDIAAAVAAQTGTAHALAALAPGVAVARVAATRTDWPPQAPAPLYLRAADAAPSRDAAPVILP